MDMVYDYINPYVEYSDKQYEVRSKFPNKAYKIDDQSSLE